MKLLTNLERWLDCGVGYFLAFAAGWLLAQVVDLARLLTK